MPVKNKEETYEKLLIIRLVIYWIWVLSIEYFLKHYKLIAIDLSKQIELKLPDVKQQNNCIGKLEKDEVAIFFIIEK